jgi:hypothetical protein
MGFSAGGHLGLEGGMWMGDGSGLSPQGFGGTITGSVEGREGGKNQELDFFSF